MSYDPNIVISDEVLATIVVTAAKQVDGVSVLLPQNFDFPRFAKKGNLRFVKLTQNQAAELSVGIGLRLCAGTKVVYVAGRVQRAVKDALQTMAGRAVACVNVRVQGID